MVRERILTDDRQTLRACLTIVSWFVVVAAVSSISVYGQNRPGGDNPIQIGRKDAPIKIEVFYDMQCPSCFAFHPVLKAALAKYKDSLFITFRHFPISLHDKAFLAAVAVESANRQGKGFEMIDMLLSNQNEWAWTSKFREFIDGYATRIGLDMTKFRAISNGAEGQVLLDMERGKALKLDSVPSVLLNGRLLSYPDAMKLDEVISGALLKLSLR
jgi:protein-disulfide isomerase